MADTLGKYYQTKNDTNGGVSLWPSPADTQLWPSFLTLAVAFVTLVLTVIVLVAYFWGEVASDRWEGRRSTFGKVVALFNILSCVVASASMNKTGNATGPGAQSLWRITCNATQEAQSLFEHVINFSQFCTMQVGFLFSFSSLCR